MCACARTRHLPPNFRTKGITYQMNSRQYLLSLLQHTVNLIPLPHAEDIINAMKALAEYCQFLQFSVVETKHGFDVLKIKGSPPIVKYSILVCNDFRIVCCYYGNEITSWDIIKLNPAIIQRYSDFRQITKLEEYDGKQDLSKILSMQ